jgi:hypothetical protein
MRVPLPERRDFAEEHMRKVAVAVLILLGMSAVAFAGTPAPEIDPSAAPGALALLSGALLVIRGRRRR